MSDDWASKEFSTVEMFHKTPHEYNTSCVVIKNIFFRVVVSNIFHFHPYLGNIPILTNIFQMG